MDNLRNLPPEERLRRLKRIEEEKKKEMADIDDIMKKYGRKRHQGTAILLIIIPGYRCPRKHTGQF